MIEQVISLLENWTIMAPTTGARSKHLRRPSQRRCAPALLPDLMTYRYLSVLGAA